MEYTLFAKPKTENHNQKTTHGEAVAVDDENIENNNQKTVDGKLVDYKRNITKKDINISKDILIQNSENFEEDFEEDFDDNSENNFSAYTENSEIIDSSTGSE